MASANTVARKFTIAKLIKSPETDGDALTDLDQILKEGDRIGLELFLYNLACDPAAEELCADFHSRYPETVYCIECRGWNICDCLNHAIANASGEWVQLSGIQTSFSAGTFIRVREITEQYDVSLISLRPTQNISRNTKSLIYFARKNCIINLRAMPFHAQQLLDACFIKTDLAREFRLTNTGFAESAIDVFLARVHEKAERYYLVDAECRIRDFVFPDGYNFEPFYDKKWYTDEIRHTLVPFIKENPSSVIRQAAVYQMMQWKFIGNVNDRNKNLLSDEELDDFLKAVSELLQYIEDGILTQFKWKHKRVLPRYMAMNFLRLKYGKKWFNVKNVKGKNDAWIVRVDGIPIEEYEKNVSLSIVAMNRENDGLAIEGELNNVYFAPHEEIRLFLCYGKKKYPVERTEVYSYAKYFGRVMKKGYMVRAVLPEEAYCSKDVRFHFEMEFRNYHDKVKCKFKGFQSRLCRQSPKAYWIFDGHILRYDVESDTFIVNKYTWLRNVCYEARLIRSLFGMNRQTGSINMKRILALRLSYWLAGPLLDNRELWLTFDQLFKGGDNGEYFFRYVRENCRDIRIYYILNKDAKEYPELKKNYRTLLQPEKFLTALYFLRAKLVFATRVDVRKYIGIPDEDEAFLRDVAKPQIVCLQHGLTIQKIAQYQNRLFDNTRYYYCVSPYEIENIRQPIYGYTDDMIALTGAPRYDGLVRGEQKDKKQILISPTWRRNVVAGTNEKGKQHEYSVNFKHTDYCRIYNELINDGRLIDCARKTGYRIVYLIHPILSPQAEDFRKNAYVDIRLGTDVNYEEILRESSLMVTDYSGIQFDFAYMRKPLVYYRPDELPAQYDEADFGFGPVCKKQEELVACLCEYMENDCRLREEYERRVSDFFPYDDGDNCKRVYEATIRRFGESR